MIIFVVFIPHKTQLLGMRTYTSRNKYYYILLKACAICTTVNAMLDLLSVKRRRY